MSSARLQAAVDQLAAAMEALDPFVRLQLAVAALSAGGHGSDQPAEARPFWLAIHDLTMGATGDRLDHLVSVLEVVGPRVRLAIATTAERAVDGDGPRTQVWRAIADLSRLADV